MSVIGPRPGLWNQDLLTAERDKYGANDVRPGVTGWAQINGRDELEIPVKAQLDGEYVKNQSFVFDMKCFFGTVSKVASGSSSARMKRAMICQRLSSAVSTLLSGRQAMSLTTL